MVERGFPIGSAIGIGAVFGMTLGLLADSMLGVDGGLGVLLGMAIGAIAGGLVDTVRMRPAIRRGSPKVPYKSGRTALR